MTLLLVAGAIASGKSTIARYLAAELSGDVVRVREALAEVLGVKGTDRQALQQQGADLDRRTNGRWLLDYLELRFESTETLVVDSMRTRRQTVPILEHTPSSFLVYLDATAETRFRRFEEAKWSDPVKRSLPFTEAMRHQTELDVVELRPMAHIVVETDDLDPTTTTSEVLAAIKAR
jgi:cytidylate kinase